MDFMCVMYHTTSNIFFFSAGDILENRFAAFMEENAASRIYQTPFHPLVPAHFLILCY